MGTFKIEVIAVGGHGQDRDKKDGEKVNFLKQGEGYFSDETPEAIAVRFVKEMKAAGINVQEAKIVHWPGETSELTDDLLTGIRKGNF